MYGIVTPLSKKFYYRHKKKYDKYQANTLYSIEHADNLILFKDYTKPQGRTRY